MPDLENRVQVLEESIRTVLQYITEGNQSISDGFKKSDSNFDKITNHFGRIEADIKIINAKIDKLYGNTSDNFVKVDGKLDDLKTEVQNIGRVTGYEDMISNLKVIKGVK